MFSLVYCDFHCLRQEYSFANLVQNMLTRPCSRKPSLAPIQMADTILILLIEALRYKPEGPGFTFQ